MFLKIKRYHYEHNDNRRNLQAKKYEIVKDGGSIDIFTNLAGMFEA